MLAFVSVGLNNITMCAYLFHLRNCTRSASFICSCNSAIPLNIDYKNAVTSYKNAAVRCEPDLDALFFDISDLKGKYLSLRWD